METIYLTYDKYNRIDGIDWKRCLETCGHRSLIADLFRPLCITTCAESTRGLAPGAASPQNWVLKVVTCLVEPKLGN